MTIPTNAAPVAAWYADPQDATQLRWWDGAKWTEHTSPVPQAAPAVASSVAPPAYGERTATAAAPVAAPDAGPAYATAPAAAPAYAMQYSAPQYGQSAQNARVAEGTPTANWLIWALVILPLISLVTLFVWDVEGYMRAIMLNPEASSVQMMLDPGYLLMTVGSWVIFAASIAFAVLDWRWLGQQGYPRRFHWAWAILNPLVYIIGRSVVVKRQAGSGYAPLWGALVVTVVSLVVGIMWAVMLFNTMFAMFEQIPGIVS